MGRLARDVGPAALAVELAGQALTGDQFAGVTIRRGRESVDQQPDAATCVLNVYENALPALPVPGDPVTVDLGPDALTWLGITADHPAVPRFRGRVTDARIVPRSVLAVDRDVVQVIAASPLAPLGRTYVGDTPWLQELDGQRATHILQAAFGTPDESAPGFVTFSAIDFGDGSWTLDGFQVYGGIVGDNALFYDPPEGAEATPATIGFSRTVAVTPGLYQLSADHFVFEAGQGTGTAHLVVDGTLYPVPVASTSGTARTPIFTVPAGTTEIEIGYRVTGATFSVYGGTLDPTFAGDSAHDSWSMQVSAVTLTPVTVDESGYVEQLGGTVQVLPRDVDRQPVLGLLTELATAARGLVLDLRDGRIGYADADDRRGTTPALTLTAAETITGTEWAATLEGVVNDVTVTYGTAPEGGQAPSVQVRDEASIAAYGSFGVSLSTQLAAAADATRTARRIVGLGAQPAYRMPRLLVDLLRTVTDPAKRLAILEFDQGAQLAVDGFPTSGPLAAARLWVEGWTEEVTATAWRVDLQVSSYLAGGPGIAYLDIPDALTFDAVPDDITHAQAWGYDPTA